jgi:long-chain acyl-CoA synthetase
MKMEMETRPWQRHYDYEVPVTLRYPRIPAQDFLHYAANGFPDKAAYQFYGSEMSYYDLRRQMLRLANALGGLGLQKGDRVGLHLPTSPQYVIAYHAVLSLGAIGVNLNPMYTPEELKRIAAETGMTTLITFDMVLLNVVQACQTVSIPRVVVTRITDYIQGLGQSTPADMGLPEGWHHFSQLIEGCTVTRVPRVTILPQDPALIQFTGGTTGVPKGAVLTHGNIVAATVQVSVWGKLTTGVIPPERRSVLAVLPYFHVYGTIVCMGWAIINAATQLLIPRFEIEEFMGLLGGFKEITFFPTVPTLINALLKHPKAGELNLDRKIKLLNSGAAPMPLELIEQVKDLGISYSEGWGMSETTSLGISNPVFGLRKAGSIGIPWPDTDVRLVDVTDGKEDVPRGEPGEILIRSPLVMQGYWDNPEETRGQLKDGWLHTGDIAVWDEDDYLYIVDRKKDMIIAGGFNIYPREIDEVLFQHPKIREAVCVGLADEYRGETVKAYVVLKEGTTATAEEIVGFCKEHLATYKVPKQVEFREALPKSAVGKILRKVLRDEEKAKSNQ